MLKLIIIYFLYRLREAIKELEENEEDLVLEIENIAGERHTFELQLHGKSQENETLKISMAEESRVRNILETEKTLLIKKLEAEQIKSNEWTLYVVPYMFFQVIPVLANDFYLFPYQKIKKYKGAIH